MPVSYDASQVLKCTVNMAYSRYFIEDRPRGVIPRFFNALDRRFSPREIARREIFPDRQANEGTGRDGTFGSGTFGAGRPVG